MRTICVFLLAVAFAGSAAHAQSNSSRQDSASIGVAWLEPDGTIVMRLIARGAGGMTGEGFLRYPRLHPQYKEILEHVGPLQPGEVRPVAPWSD
jgi:hypothetical protein